MPWVRLDDQFPDHPKVVQAGPMAAWLYVCGLAYCARHLTDGFIPAPQVPRLVVGAAPGKLVARLLHAGLWEEVAGGFNVHDFLNYNPSREESLARREETRAARVEAGRLGGIRSGQSRRSKAEAKPKQFASFAGSKTEANAKQKRSPVPHVAASPSTQPLQQETSGAVITLPPAAADSERPAAIRSLEPRYSADFEAWWAAYPRKREKVDAYAAYQKTVKAGAAPAELLAAAANYATAADEQGAEDQFIKLPATFLGPARPWLDFRAGVPRAAPRTGPAVNGRHRPSAFDQIDLAVARIKGESP